MLEIKFNVSTNCDCTGLSFSDATGDYDVTDNPTGWGTPNPEIIDIVSSIVTITSIDGITTYDIDLLTLTPDSDGIYTIPYTLFGGITGDKVPDGVYNIEWNIETGVGDVTMFTHSCELFNICNTTCIVSNMIAGVASSSIGPSACGSYNFSAGASNALLAFTYLQALKHAACCNRKDKLEEIMALIEAISNINPCQTC